MKKFWLILVFLFAVFSAEGAIAQYYSYIYGFQGRRYEGEHTLKNWNKRLKERYAIEKVLEDMEVSPSMRRKTAQVLTRFSDESQVRERLESALLSDPNVEVRWQSAISLGRLADPESIVALDKAAANDPVKRIQQTANRAAMKVRTKNALALAGNSNKDVRKEAVSKVAELSNDPVGVLAKMLRSDLDPEVRKEAARVLGHVGSVRASSALSTALKQDPNAGVRQEAKTSIANIQTKIFVRALLEKLW
jgi:HEAT repeat protein